MNLVDLKNRTAGWVQDRLGLRCLLDRKERALRIVEEAIELAQAEGVGAPDVERVAARVYSRPAGEPAQEFGGIGVCCLAYDYAARIDFTLAVATEVARIESVPADVTRAKHAAKAAAGTAVHGIPPGPRGNGWEGT